MSDYRLAKFKLGASFDSFSNDVTRVVRDAINNGLDPREFIAIVQEQWDAVLSDKQRRDAESFAKHTKG